MIDTGKLYGRGIAFPPRIGQDGRLAFSEGITNIQESIQVILLTTMKERIMLPEFGGSLQTFLFQPNTVATHTQMEDHITRSLGRWEPRIEVTSVSVQPDPQDADAAIVGLHYELVASGNADQLEFNIRFSG